MSDLSSSLASAKNGIVTAVAAGASGVKSDIYSLGTQIKTGEQGIINTLSNKIATTDAVLSSMFTEIKTLPGTFSSDLSSVASSLKTSTLSAIDTVGNTITGTVSSGYKEVTNAFGSVSSKITGALGTVSNGLHTAFSFISAFGAKLGFILEIVGITIVGIVIVDVFRLDATELMSVLIVPGSVLISVNIELRTASVVAIFALSVLIIPCVPFFMDVPRV